MLVQAYNRQDFPQIRYQKYDRPLLRQLLDLRPLHDQVVKGLNEEKTQTPSRLES